MKNSLFTLFILTAFIVTKTPAIAQTNGATSPLSGLVQPGQENTTGKALAKLDESLRTEGSAYTSDSMLATESCMKDAVRARRACLANFSEHIQTGAALLQVLISGMGALSVSESCSKYSDAMKKVGLVLTAYNAACTGFQLACNSSCKKAESTVQADLTSARGQSSSSENAKSAIPKLEKMEKAVKDQVSVCEGYKWNLAAAGAGLLATINQSGMAKSCEDATTAGGVASANGSAEVVDCSNAKFSEKPECICMQKPNSPGCPGFTGATSLAGPTGFDSAATNSQTNAALTGAPGLLNAPSDSAGIVSPTGGAAKAAGTGGSLGAGSGGGGALNGGGAGKSNGADVSKKSGLNANILSGSDGGGGGGRSGGGSYGGSGLQSYYSKYKAYLPGGARDPARGLASQTFANGQVTGAGSKSNWEKVSERYKDNKSSLMGN